MAPVDVRRFKLWQDRIDTEVEIAGEGSPLVYLHGPWGLAPDRAFVARLAERRIRFSRRNFPAPAPAIRIRCTRSMAGTISSSIPANCSTDSNYPRRHSLAIPSARFWPRNSPPPRRVRSAGWSDRSGRLMARRSSRAELDAAERGCAEDRAVRRSEWRSGAALLRRSDRRERAHRDAVAIHLGAGLHRQVRLAGRRPRLERGASIASPRRR